MEPQAPTPRATGSQGLGTPIPDTPAPEPLTTVPQAPVAEQPIPTERVQLSYEEIAEGTGIKPHIWEKNIDPNLWDEIPDPTAPKLSREAITTYFARNYSDFCMLKTRGSALAKQYLTDFAGWDERHFRLVNRTFQRAFLQYIDDNGVEGAETGTMAEKLAYLNTGVRLKPIPIYRTESPAVSIPAQSPVWATPDTQNEGPVQTSDSSPKQSPVQPPREKSPVQPSREQTYESPVTKQETPEPRTGGTSADTGYTSTPVLNQGVSGARTLKDIVPFPAKTQTPDPAVRRSNSAYVTEYDIPPTRIIFNGKIHSSKIVLFSKVWRQEKNYTGKPYDIFIDKVRLFVGTCRRLEITEDQYHAVFPDILSDRAADFFLNHIGPERRWDEMYDLLDVHFNTTVNHTQYYTDWTGITFARLRNENSEKSPLEILELLFDKLQLAQRALGEGFQGEIPLHTSVVRACRGIHELEPALIHQKLTCEALFSDLRASLNTAIERKASNSYLAEEPYAGIAPEAYIIDRRFTNNRTRGNRPAFGTRFPSNRPAFGPGRTQQTTAGYRPKVPYGGRTFQRGTCRVCHKQGCWSTNHSYEERSKTHTQYLQACNEIGQDPLPQKEYEAFVQNWEEPPETFDDDEDEGYDDLDPDSVRQGIANLTDAAFLHRLTGEDIYSSKPVVRADQFSLSGQYNQTYQGELWDTGAAQLSTVGRPQAEAYVRENPNIKIDWTPGSAEIRFGNAPPISSIGTIDVRNQLGTTKYHILETQTPFLLSLYDADRLKAYYNNILDVIVRADGKTLPVVRKWGHPFFNVSRTEAMLYLTEGQLRHLHRRFGHPRTERLYNLLKNAGHEDIEISALEEIQKFCSECQSHDPVPRRFKFTLKDEHEFNYEVIVDVVYLNGQNVLHVIDASTSFQAATFLPSLTARNTWNALCRCWIYVYQGPPDIISHDHGTHFHGEFRDHARVMGITCHEVPVEAHWAVGKVERAHTPLRRAYDIIWKDIGDRTDPETVLQMAVKALNDTAGPNGLVPTLLVFGAYPKIAKHSPPSPGIQARAEAVHKAMNMLRKIRAEVEVHRALNSRSSPYVHNILTLPLRTEVLVWREKKGWTGPFPIAAIEGRTVQVDTPGGIKDFRVTQVKQYFRNPDEEEGSTTENPPQERTENTQPDAETPEGIQEDYGEARGVEDSIAVNPIRRSQRRAEQHLTYDTPAVFLTRKERDNYDLAVKLRKDGIINSAGPPFQESDAEEINNLAARGVFEFVRFDPEKHGTKRIFKTRLVREVKGKATKPYEKSRLIVQGYGDEEKEEILTQAPTIQRMSQRLVLALGPTLIRDFEAHGELRDITQAYTQSHDKLHRTIYAELPKEIESQYPEGTLLWIILPLYGLAESGLYWFKTYHEHHVRGLEMTISTYDPCLLFTDDSPETFGITAMQTDDTLSFATAAFSQKENEKLVEAAFRAKPKEILTEKTPIEFNGGRIQLEAHDILFQQKGQVKQLKPIDPEAVDHDQQYISQRARGAYIASICQPEAAYDLSVAAQVQTPGEKDIESLNTRIAWQIENADRGLRYIPITLSRAKLYIFTDGSFANNKDLTSQLGYLIVLGQETERTKDRFGIQGNTIHWSSTKCKRVTRSVLASELYGMMSGVDSGIALSTTLRKIVRSLGLQEIPIVLCTDSRSLYECLVKLGTTDEKRLMIDIMSLRESYEKREISEICWIDGRDNPADAFTKKTPNNALEQLISTNQLTVRIEAYVERPGPYES